MYSRVYSVLWNQPVGRKGWMGDGLVLAARLAGWLDWTSAHRITPCNKTSRKRKERNQNRNLRSSTARGAAGTQPAQALARTRLHRSILPPSLAPANGYRRVNTSGGILPRAWVGMGGVAAPRAAAARQHVGNDAKGKPMSGAALWVWQHFYFVTDPHTT